MLEGTLTRRYKRFLADVRLGDGRTITVHCPNTGSLLGCAEPGSRVWLSRGTNPKRKYPFTWELVEVEGGVLVGVNTGRANRLVREAIEAGVIGELSGYDQLRTEVSFGREGSRIDVLLERARGGTERCFVEVKSVTAASDRIGLFPDAVTTRGRKHLRELMAVVEEGQRGVLCFCVQRRDVREVQPADQIDPDYGRALRQAMRAGVELIAYAAEVTTERVILRRRVPVVCPELTELT